MKTFVAMLLVFLPFTALHAQSDSAFAQTVDEILSKPSLRHSIWGVRVEEADGTVLYDRNSSSLLAPASNRKLATAAFAAECLGVHTRLQTRFRVDGRVSDGVLDGNLIIVGDGDPSLGGRFDFDRDVTLQPVVDALVRLGITRIDGGVIADVSLFDDDLIPGSWKNDNLGESYAAPVDALAWNENVVGFRADVDSCTDRFVDLTTDPHFVPGEVVVECDDDRSLRYRSTPVNEVLIRSTGSADSYPRTDRELVAIGSPALYAAQAVHDRLQRAGIDVNRYPRVSREPLAGELIATIESPPVGVLLATVLEVSQNLYAEMMLKRAAAATRPAPISYADATSAEEQFLRRIGVEGDQVDYVDGSGLSPDDLTTNRALITIVRWMAEPAREGFFSQVLARPAGEGTLRYRLKGYESRIAGKTGTINTVAALSGWADTLDGERRFFSIIVNHHTATSSEVRRAIDDIARLTADWQPATLR